MEKRAEENSKVYGSTPLVPNSREIRLINILPSTKPVQIELQAFTGTWEELQYEALSYAWGSDILRDAVLIDGFRFWVSASLHQALLHLRKAKEKRTIWIDAICINQFDVVERNSQVRQMREIYLSAKTTTIWLGNPPEGTNELFKYFAQLSMTEFLESFGSAQERVLGEQDLRCESIRRRIPGAEHDAVQISDAPWWDRMWVVQELILSNAVIVQYGDCSMEWSRVCALLDHFLIPKTPRLKDNLNVHRILAQLRLQRQSNIGERLHLEYGLLNLAYEFRSKGCGDPRDRLYGLLGLLQESQMPIRAHYELLPDSVYRDFCRTCINEHKTLLPVCISEELPHASSSWLPDWAADNKRQISLLWLDSLPRSTGIRPPWQHHWESGYSAAGGLFAVNCTVGDNDRVIIARGFLHDTIHVVGELYNGDHKELLDNWEQWMRSWRKLAFKATAKAYPNSEFAFRCTVTGGWYARGPKSWKNGSCNTLADAAAWACTGRRFFVTTGGYFGISNTDIREGDICTVLLGSDVPLVLRKEPVKHLDADRQIGWHLTTSNSKKTPLYRFVGQAYVHGIMRYKGNLFDDDKKGCIRLRDFYLI